MGNSPCGRYWAGEWLVGLVLKKSRWRLGQALLTGSGTEGKLYTSEIVSPSFGSSITAWRKSLKSTWRFGLLSEGTEYCR